MPSAEQNERILNNLRIHSQKIATDFNEFVLQTALYGVAYVTVVKDLEGNFIYECPRCHLEYTIDPNKGDINYHCEVERCNYATLQPKRDHELERETHLIDSNNEANDKGGVR